MGVVGREVVTGVGTGGRTLTAGPEEGFVALDSVTGKGAKSLNETVSSRPPGYLTFAFEGLTETRSTSSHSESYLDLRTCLLVSTFFWSSNQEGTGFPEADRL